MGVKWERGGEGGSEISLYKWVGRCVIYKLFLCILNWYKKKRERKGKDFDNRNTAIFFYNFCIVAITNI